MSDKIARLALRFAEQHFDELTSTERFVLLTLGDFAQVRDGRVECYPTAEQVALRTGFTRRTVQTTIAKLRGRRVIAVKPSSRLGEANTYTLTYLTAFEHYERIDDVIFEVTKKTAKSKNDDTPDEYRDILRQ